jgi:hypothetical protein
MRSRYKTPSRPSPKLAITSKRKGKNTDKEINQWGIMIMEEMARKIGTCS